MLAGDVRYALSIVVEDYEDYSLLQILRNISAYLQKGKDVNSPDYRSMASSFSNKIKNIEDDSNFAHATSSAKSLLETSPFAHLTPIKVARFIGNILLSDIPNSISSTEIMLLVSQIEEMLVQFRSYIDLSNALQIEDYEIDVESALRRLELPRDLFENDLDSLGKKIERFDLFFDAVAEFVSGPNSKPRILSISTTNFVAILVAHADEIVAISKIFGSLLEVVKKKIELYGALKTMKSNGISEGALKTIEESCEQTVESVKESEIKKAISDLGEKDHDGRQAELLIKIAKSSTYIINDISKGAKLSIEVERREQLEVLSGNKFGLSSDQILSLIGRQEGDQNLIATLISSGNTAFLPSPEDKLDEAASSRIK